MVREEPLPPKCQTDPWKDGNQIQTERSLATGLCPSGNPGWEKQSPEEASAVVQHRCGCHGGASEVRALICHQCALQSPKAPPPDSCRLSRLSSVAASSRKPSRVLPGVWESHASPSSLFPRFVLLLESVFPPPFCAPPFTEPVPPNQEPSIHDLTYSSLLPGRQTLLSPPHYRSGN